MACDKCASNNPEMPSISDTPKERKNMDLNHYSKVYLRKLPYVVLAGVLMTAAYWQGSNASQELAVAEALSKRPAPARTALDPILVLVDDTSGECLAMLHNARTYACSQEIPGALTYQPMPSR